MNSEKNWYKNGLYFECQQCGNCCGGASGFVFLNEQEIKTLANKFNLTIPEFRAMYTDTLYGKKAVSLREKRNYDCILFDKTEGCKVYQNRPEQCRLWPFWEAIVSEKSSWEEAGESCPGIGKGKFYNCKEINDLREKNTTNL
ncbi:MAG: YkgJ family cysteine cluster protein [Fibrobacteria bacterium]|nr:YkgJ family cysteine cluster protein [Fibrobacteria bacterium]